MTTHVVLLNPNEPNEDLVQLLRDPVYGNRVKYVKGSSISFRCLQKARVKQAEACFVLSSRYSKQDDVDDDALTVMRALVRRCFGRFEK